MWFVAKGFLYNIFKLICNSSYFVHVLLNTHQAPFLSTLEQNSCPVRQGERAEGTQGGLCLPNHDLENETQQITMRSLTNAKHVFTSPWELWALPMHLSSPHSVNIRISWYTWQEKTLFLCSAILLKMCYRGCMRKR